MARPRDDLKGDLLLDAALSEIAVRGLAALSIDATARRAKVAPATTYIYFKSKDALVEALYAKVKLGFAKAVLSDGEGPVRPAIEDACANYLHYCRRSPNELIFLEQIEASPTWKARILSTTVQAMKPLVALLGRGKAERIVRDVDSETLTAFLAGALQATARLSIDDPPDRLERRFREVVAMCWDALAN